MNPFKYSFDHKRYHTFNYHLKQHFNQKIFKVALDAGFDCPNRDGTVAYGGCTFCSVAGSGDFAGDRVDSIPVQFEKIKNKMQSFHKVKSKVHRGNANVKINDKNGYVLEKIV